MAQSFISELGDRLGGDGVANTEGEHVKTISAEYYKRNDSGTVSNQSLQTAIDGKINKAEACGGVNLLSVHLFSPSDFQFTEAVFESNESSSATYIGTSVHDAYFFGKLLEDIHINEQLTYSLDVSGLSDNEYMEFKLNSFSNNIYSIHENGHHVFNIVANTNVSKSTIVALFDDAGYSLYTTAPHGFTISNIKLERGRIATQYTRHPSEMNVYGASNAVHLTGDETITGKKLFSNNLPSLYADTVLLSHKFLHGVYGTPYKQWDSSQKDGNHFRRWIISWPNPKAIVTATFIIKLMGGWGQDKSILLLEKTISCILSTVWNDGVGGIKESYTTVNGVTVEFRVGHLHYDSNSDSFQIEIVSSSPSYDNDVYIDFTGYRLASSSSTGVLDTSISSVEIIEGWPSWAGNKTTIPRIQSNGTNVLLVGDTVTNVAIGSTAGKPLITTTNGVVTTGAFGTSAGQFAEGNTVGKVTATEKTDSTEYKLLATASASPTSGALTEAVYDTGITMNPSTNTLTANLSGIATYAKALDPQIILNSTLYKVPVISADKEVRWSGAPGASGSTTELSYDNSNGVNLLSVNISGNAASATALNVGAMANTGTFKVACFDDNGVGYWETDATKGRLLFDVATNTLGVNITGNAATASTATSATSATTATKLASSAGSTSQPVFINSSGQPQVIPLQKAANNENYLTMQCQGAYYAATAGTAADCSGNAATATSAAACTGNSATATTATKLASSAGGTSQPVFINSSGQPQVIPLQKAANNENYLTMQCQGAYYAATAGTAAACSGNAATATSAASCTGNSVTATTATKLASSAGGPSQPIYINSSGAPTAIELIKKTNNEYYLTMQCEGAYYAATAGSAATAAEATAAVSANVAGTAGVANAVSMTAMENRSYFFCVFDDNGHAVVDTTQAGRLLYSSSENLINCNIIGTAGYASHIGTSSSHPQIGSNGNPVYVSNDGVVTQCTAVNGFIGVIDVTNKDGSHWDTSTTEIAQDYIFVPPGDSSVSYTINMMRLKVGKTYKILLAGGTNGPRVDFCKNSGSSFTFYSGSLQYTTTRATVAGGTHGGSYATYVLRTDDSHLYHIWGY